MPARARAKARERPQARGRDRPRARARATARVRAVGTLKDGYIQRVPLPRVPPIQSTSPVACATIHRNPTHTGYLPIARIPTWSDMIALPHVEVDSRLERSGLKIMSLF